MQIRQNILIAILDRDQFQSEYCTFARKALDPTRLVPVFSMPRIHEAHGAWIKDLKRVGTHEKQLTDGLDHFKQSGHLSFWLRRMGPIVEFQDLDFGDSERPMTKKEKALRNLAAAYANEYIAFEFCFQVCKYYETKKEIKPDSKLKPSPRASTLYLSPEYYQTVCHFLKYKNVSPHALHLIYKSLFYYNWTDPYDVDQLREIIED